MAEKTASKPSTHLKMIEDTDDYAIVGGYGVIFGGEDLVGDTFTKSTNFMDAYFPKPVTTYDHSQSRLPMTIGETVSVKKDDVGRWYEMKIYKKSVPQEFLDIYGVTPEEWKSELEEKHNQYINVVMQRIGEQKVGLSTGSVPHMVIRKGGEIKQWPVAEIALTETPCEHRTLGVARLKSLGIDTDSTTIDVKVQGLEELRETAELIKQIKSINSDADSTEDQMSEAQEAAESQIEADTETPVEEIEGEISPQGGEEPPESKTVMETEKEAVKEPQKTDEMKAVLAGLSNISESMKSFNQKIEDQDTRLKAFENTPANDIKANVATSSFNKRELGDSEALSIKSWLLTGDGGTGTKSVRFSADNLYIGGYETDNELRAVKADIVINETTATQGPEALPTDLLPMVIAKRNESMLAPRVGVRNIPGRGLTVPVPVETNSNPRFTLTAEQNAAYANNYQRDAPTLNRIDMTLQKFTKEIPLTEEIMDDEAVNLMSFLADYVGRGQALTHNNLLTTAVTTGGTQLHTMAAGAVADGDPESIEENDVLGDYLEDNASVHWIMRNTTFGAFRKIRGADAVYGMLDRTGGPGVIRVRQLLEYPVHRSNEVAAIGTGNNSILFGNFFYLGARNGNGVAFQRNPYRISGVTLLEYSFRATYDVLNPDAIGYAAHA